LGAGGEEKRGEEILGEKRGLTGIFSWKRKGEGGGERKKLMPGERGDRGRGGSRRGDTWGLPRGKPKKRVVKMNSGGGVGIRKKSKMGKDAKWVVCKTGEKGVTGKNHENPNIEMEDLNKSKAGEKNVDNEGKRSHENVTKTLFEGNPAGESRKKGGGGER